MSPEERQALSDVIRVVECEIRQEESVIRQEEKAQAHHLIFVELCLLPIAVMVMFLVPGVAAAMALAPSLALRGYQVWRGQY